jgi:hypothetical protein
MILAAAAAHDLKKRPTDNFNLLKRKNPLHRANTPFPYKASLVVHPGIPRTVRSSYCNSSFGYWSHLRPQGRPGSYAH